MGAMGHDAGKVREVAAGQPACDEQLRSHLWSPGSPTRPSKSLREQMPHTHTHTHTHTRTHKHTHTHTHTPRLPGGRHARHPCRRRTCFTALIWSQSARLSRLFLCSRVRPCTASTLHPAASIMRAYFTVSSTLGNTRILQLTGVGLTPCSVEGGGAKLGVGGALLWNKHMRAACPPVQMPV